MISEDKYKQIAKDLAIEVATIKAVDEVESGGKAFYSTSEPVILYEPFKFSTHTKGKFDGQIVTIDGIRYPLSSSGSWSRDKAKYGSSSTQHQKLQAASKLDREAALMSCSWGKFQIMGEHWKSLGYPSLQDFINAMYKSEEEHLDAFVRFVKVNNLTKYLKSKDFAGFAYRYNGAGYKQNKYDEKLLKAYNKYS